MTPHERRGWQPGQRRATRQDPEARAAVTGGMRTIAGYLMDSSRASAHTVDTRTGEALRPSLRYAAARNTYYDLVGGGLLATDDAHTIRGFFRDPTIPYEERPVVLDSATVTAFRHRYSDTEFDIRRIGNRGMQDLVDIAIGRSEGRVEMRDEARPLVTVANAVRGGYFQNEGVEGFVGQRLAESRGVFEVSQRRRPEETATTDRSLSETTNTVRLLRELATPQTTQMIAGVLQFCRVVGGENPRLRSAFSELYGVGVDALYHAVQQNAENARLLFPYWQTMAAMEAELRGPELIDLRNRVSFVLDAVSRHVAEQEEQK